MLILWHILERIDEFSLDKEHHLRLGREELKFLYEDMLNKPLNIDLTEGIEKGVDKKRDESMFLISKMRKYIYLFIQMFMKIRPKESSVAQQPS